MKQHRTVSLGFLWQLAASICYCAVFAATPFLRDEFGLTGTTVGFVVTALTLGYAVFLLLLGAITDRYGDSGVRDPRFLRSRLHWRLLFPSRDASPEDRSKQ